ncbi:trypsin-like peptidase domain-containing protein [Streptomyces sp. NEAU-sy36]|uniref:S1C family serine protease n=1 Tax=unclassified Streptomyces TaxID=2593676 RepID=UPI0015D5C38C|nr:MULTISPECIES: trypsin-like peptidase domain-containing protein [unclassified Streptomyces]QLJ05934.1 trypsin-like peptidase domain-containing protein [Streptomyces sp. NEAU-sy36]
MSTENEGNEVPPAPSAPPVPVASPDASPQAQGGTPGTEGPTGGPEQAAQPSGADQPVGHQATAPLPPVPGSAPTTPPAGAWPPPPSGIPGYGDGAAGAGGGAWGASYQQPAPKARGRGGLVAAVLVAALVAGGLGGGLGYTLAKDNDNGGSTTVSASDNGAAQIKRAPGTIANVAAKALPSTVTIEAEGTNGDGGTGTGFVFDKQGHIITNNHVVADALDGGKLTATFPDGRKYDAEVVGHAQGYDVAVVKLKNPPSDLKPLVLGDSDKVAVGDETIAIGAPFGLSNTVTTGIISAKNRPVASSDGSSTSKASYMSALQTDASINPGNSGGPLLDASGAVIGINSAIQSTGSSGGFGSGGQSGSIGLGFAIPINQARYVAQQLIKTGKPVYAKIGASVSLEDSSDGAKITDQGAGGAAAVEAGGPADKAGLKPGDVITKLDDSVIDSGPTLIGEIWTHQPGDKVTVTYKRGGEEHTAELTLGARVGDS